MGQDREQPYSEEHIEEPANDAQSETSNELDPLVSAALELFRARPDTRWTVESIAKELGTSRPVLNRRFNEALGKPPLSVLREFRMEKASRLLLETDEGLAAIADEVGYDSEFALSRAFYRHFGVRPGAWRRGTAASHTHQSSDLTRCAA